MAQTDASRALQKDTIRWIARNFTTPVLLDMVAEVVKESSKQPVYQEAATAVQDAGDAIRKAFA